MIVMVGGKPFIPFKVVQRYLGMFSLDWFRDNEGKNGFPKRVCLSERKTGYWQSEVDAWLARRNRKRGFSKRKAA